MYIVYCVYEQCVCTIVYYEQHVPILCIMNNVYVQLCIMKQCVCTIVYYEQCVPIIIVIFDWQHGYAVVSK